MFRDDTSTVALFIDWDNLAISTAADLGNVIPGIVPEIGRIVKVAQRFGTVVVARAYSEWTSSTDRLTIYRSGVEPVYAPTFRFEPEVAGQPHRGKSLADPCLVADCIDILHLMPEISVLVLVSGDKDLIPVVRLAQLRGKRVVVVGPDLSAAILKDMADEYISYRSLIDVPEVPAEPAQVISRRRRSNGPVRTGAGAANVASSSTTAARTGAPPAAPSPSSGRPDAGAPALRQREAPVPQVAPPEPTPAPVVEPESPAAYEDPAPVFELIRTILQEREARGRPRLRATNLKDQLLARISGFNERRYGFSRFKDFLAAAERAGVLVVQDTGPVQWVTQPTSPTVAADATEGTAGDRVESVESAPSPSPNGGTPAHASADQPELDEERGSELVRFIVDLRSRSKWITFTYLLTNLVSHYERSLPANQAESEARGVLNRLVQDGVLRVDREPREIEVGGVRHRVRLCHLEEDHPLVARVLAEMPVEATTTEEPAVATADAQDAADATATTATPAGEVDVTDESRELVVSAESAESPVEVAPAPEAMQPAEVESAVEASTEGGDVPTATAGGADVPSAAESSEAARSEPEVSAEAEAPAEPSGDAPVEPMTLATAFARLREVVEATTSDEKPLAGAANIKTRLVRLLGAFDERSFGFGKFKDFLLAAEREGYVRVESSGPVTRIGLPITSGDEGADAS